MRSGMLVACGAGLIIFGSVLLAGDASENRGSNYSMDWYTIDSGGGVSTSANFRLTGSIGQPDAAKSSGTVSGSTFTLAGGFLGSTAASSPPCDGDVNGDGSVNLADLNLVLANFGATTPNGDANGDGVVNLADLNLVLANFGTDCN